MTQYFSLIKQKSKRIYSMMKKIFFAILLVCMLFISLGCISDNTTFSSEIYIFTDGVTGTRTGDLGGRSGADSICQSMYNNSFSTYFNVNKVKMLISTDTQDMKDIISTPGTKKVYGVTSTGTQTLIENTWGGLFDSSILATLQAATGASGFNGEWMSGSNADGTNSNLNDNCNNWTTNNASSDGLNGDSDALNGDWLYVGSADCSQTYLMVMCVAWSE